MTPLFDYIDKMDGVAFLLWLCAIWIFALFAWWGIVRRFEKKKG